MATRFLLKNQAADTQAVNGPSGQCYGSVRGFGFESSNPADIAFFEKDDRFVKPGLFTKTETASLLNASGDDWIKKLNKDLKVSKSSSSLIVSRFNDEDMLREALELGEKIEDFIPLKDAAIVRKAYNTR